MTVAGPNMPGTMSSDAPSSSGPEFYVRGANDTEARGPFGLEQLVSLAESGQVTADTYYYHTASEQWLTLESSEELKAKLWPEKKKLSFKQKEFQPINQEQKEGDKPITVQEFLDAAEGRTDETKGKKDVHISMMSAAIWGTRSAAIICLISAVAMALPSIDVIMSMDPAKLLEKPFAILGVADAVLGVLLLLGVISLYPLVRFRAVFGLGFLGLLFYSTGQPTAVMALAAGSAGLYFSTIFLSYIPLGVAALAGLGGMAALATLSIG